MISLGIDSGTQSTKTIAIDLDSGELLASASKAYPLIQGLPERHLEQDPAEWVAATNETVQEVVSKLGTRKNEIRAIGVSGQQHGFVPLDANDRVIRPAKLWCDTSTIAECEELHRTLGGPKNLLKEEGNAILTGYTAPKILWLKKNEPHHFRALRKILLPHDYLNFHLTGVHAMEYGDASGTGLLNVRTRSWSERIANAIDPDLLDFLPALSSSKGPLALLRDSLRQTWNLPEGIVVSKGGGDNMMGAIGTGNVRDGVVTVSLGTSGTVYSASSKPVIDEHGEIAAFCDSNDQWMPLVCTMNVTVATEQVRHLFNWDHAALESAVRSAPTGAKGLLFLPYLTGERTPNLPNGSGVFHGLTRETMTPAFMARATMEGVTLGLGYGMQRFRDLGIQPREVRLTGGGSQSAVWRQICASIFNAETVCLKSAEGAALGAAIQGAAAWQVANGKTTDIAALCKNLVHLDESTRCAPHPDDVAIHQQQLVKLTELTRRLHTSGHL